MKPSRFHPFPTFNRLIWILASCLIALQPGFLLAQRSRIPGFVDNSRRARLSGHMHPRATAENDVGVVDPGETLPSLTLVLRPSADQQSTLEKLLVDQQDPASPDYHRWLTPEDYAARFGVNEEDIEKIKGWIESQNLQVTAVARARNWISFTGAAGDVGRAFRTEFHRYNVNGRLHFANTSDPSLPVAIETAVRGVHGLNDFRLEPRAIRRSDADGSLLRPNYNASSTRHYLAPADLAVIYNFKPLHDAGFNGTGQRIVVPGQTRINLSDLQSFRARFGLPANDPDVILVPNTRDPGTNSDDLGEADLDLEWAGAAAPSAKLIYVYSNDVMDAVQYAIDQNLAPVISLSYGLCETLTSRSDALTMQSWARQANAQGITWFNASGDSGGADCVYGTSTAGAGLSVDIPASIPEVTGVGGTTFNEGSGQYWRAANGDDGGSAMSYIPETAWNDSAPQDPSSGGGGASAFFAKPSWQSGTGVPSDSARDVPDVALASSADHDGYMVYTNGKWAVFGGTSAATPVFAGIAVLLNQYLVSSGIQSGPGLGNVNPRLYALAQTVPGVFHDVTTGDNIVTVTCSSRSRNCVSGSYGYKAGPGYDQATGLGSVDAANLFAAWKGQAAAFSRGTANLTLSASSATISAGGNIVVTAVVSAANGGTPSGAVTFYLGTDTLGASALSGSGGTANTTLTVSGAQLIDGSNTITAQYSGDTAYAGATASILVSRVSSNTGPPSILGLTNGASFRQTYAPGMVLSIFGANLAPAAASAGGVPLPPQLAGVSVTINGVVAPLYFASPSQLNVQIPYGTRTTQTSQVTVTNNGRTATTSFAVTPAAPGIFSDQSGAVVPGNVAARGQILTFFITGDGNVSPAIATGSAPASSTPLAQLPVPNQAALVTVGGITAPIQFIGIPWGLVGVTQVNCRIATNTPLGTQPVVISIGAVSSPPATLTVTQ